MLIISIDAAAYSGDDRWPAQVPIKKLWDPFGFTSKMSPEKKAKSLRVRAHICRPRMLLEPCI